MSRVRDLPQGTVTFLFTDIEGSTRLLHELGDEEYARRLAEHRRLLRAAFDRHGGVEVDTQGDAFFVAFPTAPGALAAAAEAQAELDLPVRMGVHTGAPRVAEEGYVGADVHRAARMAAVGHGRQVLASAAVAALVDRTSLRDLGEHRLKDLSAPERIFQLGDAEFPPLKTLYRTNLPIPATPFLGREQELAEAGKLLARDETRLLSLTGAGGSGKTRLALQAAGAVAGSYPDGIWWVPLAPLSHAADVLPAAAQVLGGGGALDELVGDRRLLLVLDNFEHVIDAAPALAEVLGSCPNVDLLVTSRERLRIGGEQVYPVPVMVREDSREFFVARARAAQPEYEPDELVDDLCARLDDLPLALELAAARVSLLSTSQLLERLGNRLDSLRGGRDTELRQQTLRATIEWSFELLDPAEQRLLAALSVFRGGWALEAAEHVAHADVELLQSLVDKSLVRRWDSDRFGMLETIRKFALERVDETVRRRHAEYFLALGIAANLTPESQGLEHSELVRPDLDNFREAIDWAAETDLELAYELAISAEQVWVVNDSYGAARRMAMLLERGAEVPASLRARGLRVWGECEFVSGNFALAEQLSEQSLAEFEQLGDLVAVAGQLVRITVAAIVAEDAKRARRLLERSAELCHASPDARLAADIECKFAALGLLEGNPELAVERYVEGARLCGDVGFVWMQANALSNAADISFQLGGAESAAAQAREALRLQVEVDDRRGMVYTLASLARYAAADGRVDEAGRIWGAVESEEARGPVGGWDIYREEYAAAVLASRDAAFEAARAAGRLLSLDEAVAYALDP